MMPLFMKDDSAKKKGQPIAFVVVNPIRLCTLFGTEAAAEIIVGGRATLQSGHSQATLRWWYLIPNFNDFIHSIVLEMQL